MRRRSLLAHGAVLLAAPIAGCAHPSVVLDFDEATAEDVANEVSTTLEPGDESYRVVRTARENGTSQRSGRSELFDPDEPVRVDDAFYEVTETPIEEAAVTVYTVVIDFASEDPEPTRGAIATADLPDTDRRRLDRILSEGPEIEDGETLGVEYGTTNEVAEDSVFVPDQQYDILVDAGDRYAVSVETETRTETTYRVTVNEIAADVGTFADAVRDEYRFTLEGLSADERDVVEEAIAENYFEEDDAFESVVDRLREHDGIDVADFYGTWLLTYAGDEYLVYAEW